MIIYCIADLHLSLHNKDKDMAFFGPKWVDYQQKIEDNWRKIVKEDDLVLIPGDISWAMKLEDAMIDLEFIDKLPGTKVLIRGNHDYWWPSLKKLQELPFKTLNFIHNNAFFYNGVAICGTRLWDTDEFSFNEFINFRENSRAKEKKPVDNAGIFQNEIERLKLSIKAMNQDARIKIAMVHYPPIGKDLKPSIASEVFENAQIEHVCFGHLHNLKHSINPYGFARGVNYHFCSADEIDFVPQKILTL